MTAIILVLLTLIIGTIWYFNKPSPSVSTPLPRPEVIEDSSHLKAELALTQEKLSRLHQDLGQLQFQYSNSTIALEAKTVQLNELSAKFEKLQHQKKSSEVKTGTFVEILAPIAEQFCVDPKTMRFLGSPIDYVSFDYDKEMITFVEVKSGESQLNENQRAVKKMVEGGKVQFKVVRLNEKGIKVK